MIKTTPKIQIYKVTLSILLLLISINISYGLNEVKYVIISGQVTNKEYGNPVEGYTVSIVGNSSKDGNHNYFKTLITNPKGYYYDTIATTDEKGSFVVYTNDYYGNTIDTTVHFRFMGRANNILIADFLIYMPYQMHKLQARFKYVQKQGGNRNKFTFIDETNVDDIVSWHWDFGDGISSNIQNPTYTFQTNGLFEVKLTIVALLNNVLTTSAITKHLYISDRDYYNLGGHVFSQHFPIDKGNAYLYTIDSSDNYIAFDTINFDTLGYYYFYQIPRGRYIVKVEPMRTSQYYGILLPTYYGDKLMWKNADTINLISTNWEYDIRLAHSDGFSSGVGSISGNVVFEYLPSTFQNLSAKDINIYLFDDSDNLLTYSYTDMYGGFAFTSVELTTYWLYAEVTGLPAEKLKVELTPEMPTISNIELRIFESGISYVLRDGNKPDTEVIGKPYPNPTTGTLNIPLNLTTPGNILYSIYNVNGTMITTGEVTTVANANSYQLSTLSIKNGSYILRTTVNGKNYNQFFIVAR